MIWSGDGLRANESVTLLRCRMTAFGQYPGRVYDLLLYVIDNEIQISTLDMTIVRSVGCQTRPSIRRELGGPRSKTLVGSGKTFVG